MVSLPITNIGLVIFIALACAGLGRPLVMILTKGEKASFGIWSYSFTVGLLFVSTFLFFGALFKVLYPSFFIIATGFFALSALGEIIYLIKVYSKKFPNLSYLAKNTSLPSKLIIALLLALFIGSLFIALTPPHYKDELVYHLETPKNILESHGFTQEKNNIFSYFPMLIEMVYMYFIMLKAPIAAKVFHWLFGILLTLNLIGFSKRHCSLPWALLIGTLFFSVPSFFQTTTLAYVDIAYVFIFLLALQSFTKWTEQEKISLLVLSGLCLSALLGTKYLGLQAFIFLNLALFFTYRKQTMKLLFSRLVILNTPVILFSSYWYLKNYFFTGNPLFPFFYSFFSTNPALNWDAQRAQNYMSIISLYGFSPMAFLAHNITLADYLTVPFRLSFKARFEDHSLFDGIIGPAWIILAGITPFIRRSNRYFKFFSIAFMCFFTFWFFGSKQIRFLFPSLLCLSLAVSVSIQNSNKIIKSLIATVAIIGILFNITIDYKLFKRSNCLSFIQGIISADTYLSRNFRPYPIFKTINSSTDKNSVIFITGTDNLNFYLERNYLADYVFTTERLQSLLKEDELQYYLNKHGITHIFLKNKFIWGDNFGIEQSLQNAFTAFTKKHTRHITTENGYSLYEYIAGD
ncbi:ArnT family glycosyltransferase [Candidatus Omnitrophota bacterium]